MKSMKIYVAGPYSADTEEEIEANVQRAIDAGIDLFRKGHTPFIPHLSHWVELRAQERDIEMAWSDYMAWDMVWLQSCDGLLHLFPSRGANLERETARRLGLKIWYVADQIPAARS